MSCILQIEKAFPHFHSIHIFNLHSAPKGFSPDFMSACMHLQSNIRKYTLCGKPGQPARKLETRVSLYFDVYGWFIHSAQTESWNLCHSKADVKLQNPSKSCFRPNNKHSPAWHHKRATPYVVELKKVPTTNFYNQEIWSAEGMRALFSIVGRTSNEQKKANEET